MMWVLGLLFVYRFSLQSLGDTVVPMLSGALELILRISVVLVLSKVFNLAFFPSALQRSPRGSARRHCCA